MRLLRNQPMPDGRGGARAPDGRPRPPAGPGKLSQRSDLSQPAGTQGVYVESGGPYGQRKQIAQGQAAAPLPARRTAPIAGGPPRAAAPQGATQAPVPSAAMGLMDILARPTSRPDEPVTAGIPSGPGPGVVTSGPAGGMVSSIIEQAARATGNPDLLALAQRAQALGQ
jgi:hypothetical protein